MRVEAWDVEADCFKSEAGFHPNKDMINPKLKNLATDYTDRHGFSN